MIMHNGSAGPAEEPPSPVQPGVLNVAMGPDSTVLRGEDLALLLCGYIGASGRVYSTLDLATASERSTAPLYCQIGKFVKDDSGQLVLQALE